MGVSLGLFGGGGSIIALPMLVYLFHIDPDVAIVYSLLMVGSTSFFAATNHLKSGNVVSRVALQFGVASVLMVAATRYFITPALPAVFGIIAGVTIHKSVVLLLLFGTVMLLAARSMLKTAATATFDSAPASALSLAVCGTGVGLLTGLLGAGGGFLIVPTLVHFAHLDIKKAIGTSLVIIGSNALIGFFVSVWQKPQAIDWAFLGVFLALAFVGTWLGAQLSQRINSAALKPAFGWFVLVMGAYIIAKELFF